MDVLNKAENESETNWITGESYILLYIEYQMFPARLGTSFLTFLTSRGFRNEDILLSVCNIRLHMFQIQITSNWIISTTLNNFPCGS